jgi:hypothetical protein
MPNDLKLVSVPTLVSEELVPFPDFEARFKQALVDHCTYEMTTLGVMTGMTVTFERFLEPRLSGDITAFFRDWITLLMMDPRERTRKALHPVEFAAVVELTGFKYYTFPKMTPTFGPKGQTLEMALSPVPV